MSRERLLIVGAGMVGHRLCRALVERGGLDQFDVHVVGEEPWPAYDRLRLTRLLSGGRISDLLLSPPQWYERHGIQLHLGDPVERIEPAARRIVVGGARLAYDRLVFATGSRPFVPPIQGRDLPGVMVYRSISDAWAIKERAPAIRRAAVIGGGLLGLEAAKALLDLGLETHVVEFADRLMVQQLDAEAATMLQAEIERLGITVHLDRFTARIREVDRGPEAPGLEMVFSDDSTMEVGLVVIAAGIRPRDELAVAAGLKIGRFGGILVDDQLRASDPRIYAVGECACPEDRLYGLVSPGYQMASVIADNLTGGRARFRSADLSARLKILGLNVASIRMPRDREPRDGLRTWRWQQGGIYRSLVTRRGRLIRATCLGEWDDYSRLYAAFLRRRRLWPTQLRRFEETGSLWRQPLPPAVQDWPAGTPVCICTGVTRGDLERALERGASTTDELAARTGASTVCGSCRPLIVELVAEDEETTLDGGELRRPILVASGAAATLGLGFFLVDPLPFAASVHALAPVDLLLRVDLWKHVTGIALVALTILAAVFPLLQRAAPLKGRISWRAAHALVGVAALVMLTAHTGFHTGEHLNRLLLLDFLALNLAGAAAGFGILRAEEGAAGPRRRAPFYWGHLLFLAPLPALVAAHVAAALYFG